MELVLNQQILSLGVSGLHEASENLPLTPVLKGIGLDLQVWAICITESLEVQEPQKDLGRKAYMLHLGFVKGERRDVAQRRVRINGYLVERGMKDPGPHPRGLFDTPGLKRRKRELR